MIQIPCYNEEKTLPQVLEKLKKKIDGISEIEVQIVDDGCTDKTVEIAKKYGCYIVSYVGNKGLGHAFKTGMDEALARGADILVNTDGDHQYKGKYIKDLVKQTAKIAHFSKLKKFFQWFGSLSVRYLTQADIKDAVSGFRAYSREAMLQLNVVTKFSYVLDTLVQGSKKGLKIVFVPVTTNKPTRPSRLFKGMFEHIKKSGANLLRVYMMYEPFKTFLLLGGFLCVIGAIPIVRFFYHYVFDPGNYIQSLIIGSIIFLTGINMIGIGLMAELNAINRRLTEETLYLKKISLYGRNGKGKN